MGSALQYYRKMLVDFPHKPFLTPDPARVAGYRAMLGAKRAKYYSTVDAWGPVLKSEGVTFFNLQYGDCAEELKRMQEKFGITVELIPGLDLRDDIDGAAALSAALDLVISAPTAAAATAASVGAEVWFMTAGRTWPQLGPDEFPWYADTKVISPQKFGDWSEVMAITAERLAKLVK